MKSSSSHRPRYGGAPRGTTWMFSLISVVALTYTSIILPGTVLARFPPNAVPFRDECMGIDLANCRDRADRGKCSFFQDQYPWCFDRNFAALQPKRKARVGISTLFFTFSSGVHLSGKSTGQTGIRSNVAELTLLGN